MFHALRGTVWATNFQVINQLDSQDNWRQKKVFHDRLPYQPW
jgi:hypothetical protein